MKKYWFGLPAALFVALLCIVTPAHAVPPVRSVDVTPFDVGGVKTGMSGDEARAAMQKNFCISADQIRVSQYSKDQAPYLVTKHEEC